MTFGVGLAVFFFDVELSEEVERYHSVHVYNDAGQQYRHGKLETLETIIISSNSQTVIFGISYNYINYT